MSGEGEDMRVQLARIEGKMDLSNLRHDQTEARLMDHDQRLHVHGNRLANIEAREHLREGERKGIAMGGKAIQWLTGGGVVGILAMIARHFGV
jgi:hypothetical protein